jgi:hypothetical protein
MNWINVKDRLPELNQRVLVVEQWQNPNQPMQYDINIAKYYVITYGEDEQDIQLFPTHWMPIPLF